MVKGATALDLRFGEQVRGTRDLDLSHPGDRQIVSRDMLEAESIELDDYFTFAIQPTEKLAPLGGIAIRFQVAAELAGRRFEDFHVDIGVDSQPVISPDVVTGPHLLTFADIDPVSVQVIAIEQHIAEKVAAYVRIYAGQRRSSRVKDLVDLVLIQALGSVHAGRLRHALEVTFQKGAIDVPVELPPPPVYWVQPYVVMASEIGIDPDLNHGYNVAATFLNPVLSGSANNDAVWNPQQRGWLADN